MSYDIIHMGYLSLRHRVWILEYEHDDGVVSATQLNEASLN